MGCDSCLKACDKSGGNCNQMGWKAWLLAIFGGWILVGGVAAATLPAASAKEAACLTREQVETAVKEEEKCLTIFGGGVYDFSLAKKWDLTGHVKKHACGKEYDQATIEEGPHKLAVIDKFYLTNVCGETAVRAPEKPKVNWLVQFKAWPQEVFGVTWRMFWAYASLIFFLLNFLTCYAMPWSRVKQPWEGSVPGHDVKDTLGRFPLTYWHKYFAWAAIFTLSMHGALGFSCALLGVCF